MHSGWGCGTPRPLKFPRSPILTLCHLPRRFHSPYILPSSVPSKSFACHSYENTGGVGKFFPNWNASALRPKFRSSYAASEMPALSRGSAGPRNSHGIISFADPHSLSSLESYRYKNVGGGGGPSPQGNGGSPSKNKKHGTGVPCFSIPSAARNRPQIDILREARRRSSRSPPWSWRGSHQTGRSRIRADRSGLEPGHNPSKHTSRKAFARQPLP